MEKSYEKKITWTVKNFSSLKSLKIYSDQFVVGGCKWRLMAYPKGDSDNSFLSLYLEVSDCDSLPSGWKRHATFRLTVVNQLSGELSKMNESSHQWFDQKSPSLGFSKMLPLTKLRDENDGFLVNGDVKIIAEVDVLEAIGKSDVLEETSSVLEDVNGFHVFPSQVESVKSLLEKHSDIASKFRPQNQHLRTTYLNVLLSLTEALCNSSPEELSNDDLANAYSSLRYVTIAGFKTDWLEKKLKEAGKKRMYEMEEELKDLKHKCSEMDDLLEFLR